MKLNLRQFADECGAHLPGGGGETVLAGISHDSRTVEAGDLFVCLVGQHSRGEKFLAEAAARGAVAALIQDDFAVGADCPLPLASVKDATEALKIFALGRRARFSGQCAAVTGSVGKTTTREILAGILTATGAGVVASAGNQNTELGLWLTLARLELSHRYLVLEMGARHRADIKTLCQYARPSLGLITAIEPVHMQTFTTLEEIMRAKAEIYDALEDDACAVLNADLACAHELLVHIGCEKLCLYSIRPDAPETRFKALNRVRAAMQLPPAQLQVSPAAAPQPGRCTVRAGLDTVTIDHQIHAEHNLSHLLGAVTAACAMGEEAQAVAQACLHVRLPARRLEHIAMGDGNLLIDDSYNASPAALLKGLDYARRQRQRLWLVVGEMAELGASETAALDGLVQQMSVCPPDRLICVGDQAATLASACPERAQCFSGAQQTLQWLLEQRPSDTCVYVKASRSAKLDELVDAFVQNSPLCSTN